MVASEGKAISFEWDPEKDRANQAKHGVSFADAQVAFFDEHRVLAEGSRHGTAGERRYFCFGKLGDGILTVRFTYRREVIRIFGAGYWARGKLVYEQENQVHERSGGTHKDH